MPRVSALKFWQAASMEGVQMSYQHQRAVVALVAVLALTGCGRDEPASAPAKSTSAPTPLLMTVTGSLTVGLGRFTWNPGQGCWGYGRGKEITAGTAVTVLDSTGATVGLGRLEPGSVIMNPNDPTRATGCRYNFTVPNVPTGRKFYAVQASGAQGSSQHTEQELSERLDLTCGYNG